MTRRYARVALVLFALTGAAPLAAAQDLDPTAAAGKIIFEETAGGVGCQSCHGMDATGDVGPDIRGRSSEDILAQLESNEAMAFIELTDEERDQVATYLLYLHDLQAH